MSSWLIAFYFGIHLITGLASGAYINVTFPENNAKVNSTLIFVLDAFDPPFGSRLNKFEFQYKDSTGTEVLAISNSFLKIFELDPTLPPAFSGRFTIPSSSQNRTEIRISPIKFEDEKREFSFHMVYYSSTGALIPLDSSKLQLQNVYALPVFDAGSMSSSSDVIEGKTSSLTCVVRSRPAATVTWTYDNATINATQASTTATDGYYTIVTSVITITNPSQSINGKQLSCSAQHQFSFAISRTTAINVQCFTTCAYLNVTWPESNTEINSTLTFVLDAFDPAFSSSFFDAVTFEFKSSASRPYGRLVDSNRRLKKFILENPMPAAFDGRVALSSSSEFNVTITISPIKFEDESREFVFRNKYFTSSGTKEEIFCRTLQLKNVYSLPVFDAGSMSSSSNVMEGRTSSITCIVRSRPAATITWTYDNTTINATHSSTISIDGYYSIITNVITISNPSRSINGKQLTCSAQHQFSFAINRTTTINSQYKPDQVNLTASYIKPHNGSSVTFRCSSRANPPASYRFYSVAGSVPTLLQNSTSATYTIANINYAGYIAYKATIRCIPYNRAGDGVAVNATVDIQVSPQLQVATSMTVIEGQYFNLYCNVTAANPRATITWRNPQGSTIVHTNGMVRFSSVRKNENGTYTCASSNGIGPGSNKTTVLDVLYGPEIVTKAGIVTACKPDVVNITCFGLGYPAPLMRIMFQNTEKSRGLEKTYYVIRDLRDEDFGIYTCIARNSVKEVNRTVILQMRADPGAVTDIAYRLGPGKIEVRWKLPECKGANGIRTIRVKYKKKGQSSWQQKDAKSNFDVKLTIDGLDKGADYDVQVFVVDGNGKEHAASNSSTTIGTENIHASKKQINTFAIALYAVIPLALCVVLLLSWWNFKLKKTIYQMKGTKSINFKETSGPGNKSYEPVYTDLGPENSGAIIQPYGTVSNPFAVEYANIGASNDANYMNLGPRNNIEKPGVAISKDYEEINTTL